MLAAFDGELFERNRRHIQTDPRQPIALDLAFDPQKHLCVDGLRARVPAPEPPGDRSEEKQRHRGENQQDREIDEILWPEDQAENVELARGEIEQHGLAPVPIEPCKPIEDELRENDEENPPEETNELWYKVSCSCSGLGATGARLMVGYG